MNEWKKFEFKHKPVKHMLVSKWHRHFLKLHQLNECKSEVTFWENILTIFAMEVIPDSHGYGSFLSTKSTMKLEKLILGYK